MVYKTSDGDYPSEVLFYDYVSTFSNWNKTKMLVDGVR